MTDQNDDKIQPFFGGDTTFISSTTGKTRTFWPGDIVDGAYQLTSLLGQGGMGIVFACHHIVLGKEYAIKILSGEQLNEEYWARFRVEAQALAKLNHPSIVGIHNMGVDDGQCPYYVMDLLSGEPLDLFIERAGHLPVNEALDVFIQVADALNSAHLQGIIHRDIKPSNLMLLKDDRNHIVGVKIVDFGIARLSKHCFATQSQTKTGLVFGTPFYMSPEQCQGLRVDKRSDIYSLGCTIFEALTGSPPFHGENAFQTFMLHQAEPAPSLKSVAPEGNFAEALEQALAKMLAKGLTERYQTMAQVKHDLERIKAGKSILAQGLYTTLTNETIKESANATLKDAQRSRKLEHLDDDQQKDKKDRLALSVSKIALIAGAIIVVLTGAYFLLSRPAVQTKRATAASLHAANDAALLNAHSVQNPGLEELVELHFKHFYQDANKFGEKNAQYRRNPQTARSPFRQNGSPAGFLFPKDFFIAAIKFDHGRPSMASGFVRAPEQKPVYIYLSMENRDWPGILDKFGPDDLTGLELVSTDPEQVVQKIIRWHHLKELSFFNSLLKAPASKLQCDQSIIDNKNLAAIDKLAHLQSLGLCGPSVSGEAVLKMRLLDTLQTLKLKGIAGLAPLLSALPTKDNLKEIWLVNQATTDDQLEALTKLKNLETLRIRRGKLTPLSLQYFKRMPVLRHLYLDADWSEAERAQFIKDLPVCQFEPEIDYTYWQMFPGQEIYP